MEFIANILNLNSVINGWQELPFFCNNDTNNSSFAGLFTRIQVILFDV